MDWQPHRFRLLDPPGPGGSPYEPEPKTWTLMADDVAGNFQPLTGDVEQTAAGRQIDATWKAFVDPAVEYHEDQGIELISGVGPERFRIRQVGEQGQGFDTELMLAVTMEEFPTEPEA